MQYNPYDTKRAAIHWKTLPTEYYDIATGEQITKWEAQHNYIKLKTNKDVKLNEHKTHGTIKHTIECQRQPQLKLL